MLYVEKIGFINRMFLQFLTYQPQRGIYHDGSWSVCYTQWDNM